MVFVCFLDLDFWVLEMIWMVKQSISNHLELQMTFWNKIPKTDNCAARIKISIAFFSFSRWDFHRSDLLLSEGWVQLNSNLEASCKLYQQFLMTWQKEHFCSFVRRYSGIRPVFTRERGVFYWYCYRASYSRIVRSCSILSPEKGKKLWWITCTLVTLHQNIDWPEKWPSKRVL